MIEFTNPMTSADLLERGGYVYIQKSQLGGGSPMIRGLSTNRLVLSVDGVRLNNAIFRSGNIHNVISISPMNIENTWLVFLRIDQLLQEDFAKSRKNPCCLAVFCSSLNFSSSCIFNKIHKVFINS